MREMAIGAIVTLCVLFLVAVAGAPSVPDLSILGPLARMIEGLTVHFWCVTLILTLGLLILRAEAVGVAILLVLVLQSGLYGWQHVTQSERLTDAAGPRLRVVWFNMLNTNKMPADSLQAALEQSGADVIVLTEARALRGRYDALAETYPHQFRCAGACALVVLSRLPLTLTEGPDPDSRFPEQRLRVDLAPDGAAPLSIVAGHLFKPWFIEMAYADRRRLSKMINRAGDNVLVLGDFNAAPWSLPVQQVLRWSDLTVPFRPRPSWPAPVFWAGVPLDHVFWRGGVKIAALQPFGGSLGSNHRGLMVDVVLPAPSTTR